MSEQIHLTNAVETVATDVAYNGNRAQYTAAARYINQAEQSGYENKLDNDLITFNNPDIAYGVAWDVKPTIDVIADKEHRINNPFETAASFITPEGKTVYVGAEDVTGHKLVKRGAEVDLNRNINSVLEAAKLSGRIAVNSAGDREAPKLDRPFTPEAPQNYRKIPDRQRSSGRETTEEYTARMLRENPAMAERAAQSRQSIPDRNRDRQLAPYRQRF